MFKLQPRDIVNLKALGNVIVETIKEEYNIRIAATSFTGNLSDNYKHHIETSAIILISSICMYYIFSNYDKNEMNETKISKWNKITLFKNQKVLVKSIFYFIIVYLQSTQSAS